MKNRAYFFETNVLKLVFTIPLLIHALMLKGNELFQSLPEEAAAPLSSLDSEASCSVTTIAKSYLIPTLIVGALIAVILFWQLKNRSNKNI